MMKNFKIGEDNETKEQSWQKIFNISNSDMIQAVFWELRLERIIKVTDFVAR